MKLSSSVIVLLGAINVSAGSYLRPGDDSQPLQHQEKPSPNRGMETDGPVAKENSGSNLASWVNGQLPLTAKMGLSSNENAGVRSTASIGVNFALDLMTTRPDKAAKERYAQVAAAYQIPLVKIWTWQDTELLDALESAYGATGTELEVMIKIPDGQVIAFADSAERARDLLPVLDRYPFVKSVAVGNEPDFPRGAPPQGHELESFNRLPDALANVHAALRGSGVLVTVPFSNGVVDANKGNWNDVIIRPRNVDVVTRCMPHLDFWTFNPYPYFNFRPTAASEDDLAWNNWILGVAPLHDHGTSSMLEDQLLNMRHALVALNAGGSGSKEIAVGETGWPTAGTAGATIANARLFYQSLWRDLETMTTTYNLKAGYVFLFELFDEKRKPGHGAEPNFGLLNEDGSPKAGLTEFVLGGSAPTPTPPPPASHCGCSTCTDAVWNTRVRDGAGTHTCGDRIRYSQTRDGGSNSEYDSCKKVSEEFPSDQCGPSCNPLVCGDSAPTSSAPTSSAPTSSAPTSIAPTSIAPTSSAPTSPPPASHCGCSTCTDAVWNTPVRDGAGTHTCGDRIRYLQTRWSNSEYDSCKKVSEEFASDQCGPSCNPLVCGDSAPTPPPPASHCGCSTCTDAVWNTPVRDGAGTHTCGDRISFLQTRRGGSKSEYDSCKQVSQEFASDQCGPSCNPLVCD